MSAENLILQIPFEATDPRVDILPLVVAAYGKLNVKIAVKSGLEGCRLLIGVGNGPKVYSGSHHICYMLLSLFDNTLLGDNGEESAQITDWLSNRCTYFEPLRLKCETFFSSSDALGNLNDYLEDKVFLVGNSITLADISMWSSIFPYFGRSTSVASAYSLHRAYPNVARWCDFLQHILFTDAFVRNTVIPSSLYGPVVRFQKSHLRC
eukprot:Nk52_evm79s217 gene=Nk52_evmTU79s217